MHSIYIRIYSTSCSDVILIVLKHCTQYYISEVNIYYSVHLSESFSYFPDYKAREVQPLSLPVCMAPAPSFFLFLPPV